VTSAAADATGGRAGATGGAAPFGGAAHPGPPPAGAGTILFLRHGRTVFNAEGRLQGQVDIPLDVVGQWQARTGAKALVQAHTPDLIVSSDLVRAWETAAAVRDAAPVDIVKDARLRERGFGIWEGFTGQELAAQYPEEWVQWRRGVENEKVGAEPKHEAAARVVEAVHEHAASVAAGGTLVVVSHGAAITIAITELLGLDPEQWRGLGGLNNVHWSRVERNRRSPNPTWRLVGHNLGAGYPLDHWNAGPDWSLGQEPA